MVSRAGVGEVELQLLTFLETSGPMSVKQATDSFGEEHGLARTTIQTMMERLRKKGYLLREKEGGVYQYRVLVQKQKVLREAVRRFVDKTLGGTLTPFFAYLTEEAECSEEELVELKALVQRLEDQSDE